MFEIKKVTSSAVSKGDAANGGMDNSTKRENLQPEEHVLEAYSPQPCDPSVDCDPCSP